jgi:RNA polymerase sigma factor (sigma-70 family)
LFVLQLFKVFKSDARGSNVHQDLSGHGVDFANLHKFNNIHKNYAKTAGWSAIVAYACHFQSLYNMLMTTPAYTDSADLYAACGSRETAVQAEAYRELWDYLYRIAFHIARAQPDQEALAQDCAQRALLRIHKQRKTCEEPKAFRSWCRRIVTNLAIDELRRRQRLQPLDSTAEAALNSSANPKISLERQVLAALSLTELRNLLLHSPMSDRSQRVVIGRYLDDIEDESLAETESELAGNEVLPSHIQVTRSKNIAKLKKWEALREALKP